jgi:hypothetical protein
VVATVSSSSSTSTSMQHTTLPPRANPWPSQLASRPPTLQRQPCLHRHCSSSSGGAARAVVAHATPPDTESQDSEKQQQQQQQQQQQPDKRQRSSSPDGGSSRLLNIDDPQLVVGDCIALLAAALYRCAGLQSLLPGAGHI